MGGDILDLDRLPGPGAPVEVVSVSGARFGAAGSRPRSPHRHDYHELIWTRAGGGRHLIDGTEWPVVPHSVTLIGRGQVHVFAEARDLDGAVVRFTDDVLHADAGALVLPGRLLATGPRTVRVPAGDEPRLEALVGALAAEARRRPDVRTPDLQRHLLAALLLLVERWHDDSRAGYAVPDDEDLALHRRFVDLLERDFARRRDVAHYAGALRVPAAALARALAGVTGRTTRELVADRVMLEAARLLRFTDLGVGEVAHRVGFDDPLYFSRAFRRHRGESPSAFRSRTRGRD